jgi:DNA-binding MarR family transcriptional regulator
MNAKNEAYGVGSYQMKKAYFARRAIFKALYDGQWHRNMELREKTKLSSRTLTKHLDRLIKSCLVERKTDNESGKYPIPVLYRAESELLAYMKSSLLREDFAENVNAMLKETNDPLKILEIIHDYSQLAFLHILEQMKRKKDISDEEIEFLEEIFLWSNYKSFTFELVEATRRIAESLDINQLLVAQAKRVRMTVEETLRKYKEMGLAKE